MKQVLTIAGSDSGAGAGIQADLKTFSALGVYGLSVITSVTAQNTQGVIGIEDLSLEIVDKQLEVIFSDIRVDAIKIGMVSKEDIIKIISENLQKRNCKNIILDPVMISETGHSLLAKEAVDSLLNDLCPLSFLITPNLPEAEAILDQNINTVKEMKKAAKKIYNFGTENVLLKGGHLKGEAIDILFDGHDFFEYNVKRINTKNTHGTGCTYSSAIAAYIARGYKLPEAIDKAKKYITKALKYSIDIGKGSGTPNRFFSIKD